MTFLTRGLLVIAAAGAIAFPSLPPTDAPPPATTEKGAVSHPVSGYSPLNVEYYMADDYLGWIRPGLNFTIVGVTDFAPGKKPVVEIKMTDDLGMPLDRKGAVTPGPIAPRFVPATYDPATGYYTDLLVASNGNPTRETAGTFEEIAIGHYKYTFALALGTFDATKPATLRVGGRRTMTDIIGKDYWAVDTFKDFVPSTGASATAWTATTATACNNCHELLFAHGGNYRHVKTCEMCHNPNNMKGGIAEFDGTHFWHLLHAGHSEDIGEVTFPQAINNCDGCHDKTAANGKTWQTKPSRRACGGCHVDVNFDTGEGHGDFPQVDDSQCASCHVPDSGEEWDASIVGAHKLNYESKQVRGLVATVVGATNVKPGMAPTVQIKVTNKDDGSKVDPTKLSTFSPILGGPTYDYQWYFREDARSKATYDAATNVATYTFTGKIPADAKGSVVFSADVYRTVALKRADGGPDRSFRDAAPNPIYYASTSTAPVEARRTSIDLAKCNKCHDRLALHGEQRLVGQECVICHHPKKDDADRRPPADYPVESIDMKRMTHRIHTGDLLWNDFTIYGYGNNPINFNEITYPQDRRNCIGCHQDNTDYLPSEDPRRVDTPTPRDFFTPHGPTTAACLGCHDSKGAAAHAYLNYAPFGEACTACHGPNSDWAPNVVHAR